MDQCLLIADAPSQAAVPRRALKRQCPEISVLVPALNEEHQVARAIRSATSVMGVQVVVADGGRVDATATVARALGALVVSSSAGRALQMNTAAAAARGRILVFLHADTRLPVGFDQVVRDVLDRPGVVAGAFRLSIDARGVSRRVTGALANLRSRYLQLPYGDQAIFLRAKTFHRLGGFPEIPVMEDYELVRRLRRLGRVEIGPTAVRTSARRWLSQGLWRTAWIHPLSIAGYHLGVSPHRIARWRRDQAPDSVSVSACVR